MREIISFRLVLFVMFIMVLQLSYLYKSVVATNYYTSLSAGYYHTCAIEHRQGVDTGGGLRCWGQNTHGQIFPPPGVFKQVSSGHFFSCAISIDNKVKCWGSIQEIPDMYKNERFKSVSSGKAHACGLTPSGKVHCWGRNTFGEASPPPRGGGGGTYTTYSRISCGDSITCGMIFPLFHPHDTIRSFCSSVCRSKRNMCIGFQPYSPMLGIQKELDSIQK